MSLILFTCAGGHIVLPDRTMVLVSRQDGGNLLVNPLRTVWERSELTAAELMRWSFLGAATGKAMLDVLPQLQGGCINYWEAGNWALNEQAKPVGAKTAKKFRQVHLHLLGRSPAATDPSYRWGEAPKFPDYSERLSWVANHERLNAYECRKIITQVERLLQTQYEMPADQLAAWRSCALCGYPMVLKQPPENHCPECQILSPTREPA